jgi:hypothetical protein
VCVNSTDPRCGDFRWDPAPPAQELAHIDSVEVDPPHPVVGQEVTITVHWSDPNADIFVGPLEICDGQGPGGVCLAASVAAPPCHGTAYGPWTLPPARPGAGTFVGRFTYHTAGTFTWLLDGFTESSAFGEFHRDHDACVRDPYESGLGASDSITVLPELPPFPTIPQ